VNSDEGSVLGLDIQLIGIQNSLCTWVRRSEHVRVSTFEIKPTCLVYELHTRLALSNVIRAYGTVINSFNFI